MKKYTAQLILALAVAAGGVFLVHHQPPSSAPPVAAVNREMPPSGTSAVVSTNAEKSGLTGSLPAVAPVALLPKPTPRELALKYLALIQPLLDSTNQADHDLIYTNLLRGLIVEDPAMAGGLAASLAPGDVRQEFVRRVAQGWAAVDPAGATAWAAGLTDVEERSSTLSDVAFQIAQADPAAAVALAEKLDFGSRNGTLENLAQQWAGRDFAATLDWAIQQPAGEQRDQIMSRIAFVQAHSEPAAAVNLIVTQIPPGPAQDEAAMSVLQQWGMQDYQAASDWAGQFPAGPLRNRALAELSGIAQYSQSLNSKN
jgi:hypothetical protein